MSGAGAAAVPIRVVGDRSRHAFFGYYNKSNFDRADARLLGHRVPMMTGDLTGTEPAEVGFFDLRDGDRFHRLGETTAWNWQMGCQLQWLGTGDRVIFNARADGPGGADNRYPDFRAHVVDVASGQTRTLPLPIYVVAPDGSFALCVNYSRFIVTHRTIGYPATRAEPPQALAPADDGIFRMDIATGAADLLVSLAALTRHQPLPSMRHAMHWITHMEVNPSGTRCLFLHRWTERPDDETCYLHRLYSMNSDGSGLQLLECTDHPLPQLDQTFDARAVGVFDYEKSEFQISHPMWMSDDEIIVWGPHGGRINYQCYNVATGVVTAIGAGTLTENGHMTCSADGRWILSDTYPDARTDERILFLYEIATGRKIDLGLFYTPKDLGKHNRCDLHPRWSRDNRLICIDSVHEGARQMYLLDVSAIVRPVAGAD